MKIAVMSDSHDHVARIERVIEASHREECSVLLHLGDIISPFAALRLKGFRGAVRAVFGNNDGERLGLQRAFASFSGTIDNPPLTLTLEGKRIVMMHDPFLLEEAARSQELDFVLYGHMHEADLRRVGRTTILNPGDSSGWLAAPSFFIVDLTDGECRRVDL